MKKPLFAVALAASAFAFAPTASAITFSSLTTIYVGSGVIDSGSPAETGVATVFSCSNVSGLTATVRYVVLHTSGPVAGSLTRTAAHGVTNTVSTHDTLLFVEAQNIAPGVLMSQGSIINIESTESAVFCTGMIVDAASAVPQGIDLHLVRVNPHPGTVE